MTVPTHVSAVFSYSEGYFALEGMKNLSCLGRQKRFLSCERVTKRSRIEVKVIKSSVSAPFEKLEFGDYFFDCSVHQSLVLQ